MRKAGDPQTIVADIELNRRERLRVALSDHAGADVLTIERLQSDYGGNLRPAFGKVVVGTRHAAALASAVARAAELVTGPTRTG